MTPEEREVAYEAAWHRLGFGFALTYFDILLSKPANDTAAEFIRRKIALAVKDPALRQKLTPWDSPFASRRPSVDSGYFETFNRDNVELADIRESPIERVHAGRHPDDGQGTQIRHRSFTRRASTCSPARC